MPRGGFGAFNNGMGIMGGMGGMMGGMAGAAGRNFTTDLYADYSGPEAAAAAGGMNGGVMDGPGMGMGMPMVAAEPSAQIYVRNVSFGAACIASQPCFES